MGRLRFFLGLNTILPSADFHQWNNVCGFWTMTEFILFYTIIPFMICISNTYKKSVLLYFFCFATALLTNYLTPYLPQNEFSQPEKLLLWSPLMQMHHFALGMVIFLGIRDNKTGGATILCSVLAVLMMMTRLALAKYAFIDYAHLKALSTGLLFSSSAGITILMFQKMPNYLQGGKWLAFSPNTVFMYI